MSKAAGWIAIGLAVLALAPSFVPGAVSVIGLLLSMLAVALSLLSIRKSGKKYFAVTLAIALAGVFLVNDVLRVWSPLPAPLKIKLFLYAMVLVVFGACVFIAVRQAPLSSEAKDLADAAAPPTDVL